MPVLWYSFTAVAVIICSIFHFAFRRKEYSIEFLFSLALLQSGAAITFNLPWLKLVFFPLIVLSTAFYSSGTVIPLALLLPFIQTITFPVQKNLVSESAFLVLLIMTAVISVTVVSRLRTKTEKTMASLQTIRESAKDISHGTRMESLTSDKIISHYFASMLKTDEEIGELLTTVKHSVFADSANLFIPRDKSFVLRCSSEENAHIIVTGRGIVSQCIKDKKPFSSSEINEKETEVGYLKDEKIKSLIAMPVLDGTAIVGVLAVDSSRFQAFRRPDVKVVQMFAGQLVRIFERERIYPKMKRDHDGIKILHEESRKLVSSLNADIIAEKLCEGAEKIAESDIYFFIAKGKKFELLRHTGKVSEQKKVFNLNGTFMNMAVENKQPIYISDTSTYRIPIMPFRTDSVRAVIVVPLLYENGLLGLFAMLSRKTEFLDAFQQELLKVMCNQASTSIANAKLHARIERLATTDGLTGLFNHRHFQEKLAEELKRLNRFSGPTSLILTDIDYFKKINDSYGHPVGDMVLKAVARTTKATIRDIDTPARYGGEEFAAILPGTDGKGAKQIAERLRKAVMAQTFGSDGTSFKVTISIGIATSPDDAQSKEELVEKADQALYYAKHNGRNQSITWSSIR